MQWPLFNVVFLLSLMIYKFWQHKFSVYFVFTRFSDEAELFYI